MFIFIVGLENVVYGFSILVIVCLYVNVSNSVNSVKVLGYVIVDFNVYWNINLIVKVFINI